MHETETTAAPGAQVPEALRDLELMIGTWDLRGRGYEATMTRVSEAP